MAKASAIAMFSSLLTFVATLPLTPPIDHSTVPTLYLWNATHLSNLRQQISNNYSVPRSTFLALQHLRHQTETDLTNIQKWGMPTVTNKSVPAPGANGDLHYFTSVVPYAFPCTHLPKNCLGYKSRLHIDTRCHENGLPWKICDGVLNQNMLFPDRRALERMIHYVIRLSLSGYLLQDYRRSKVAADLLKTWFLNPLTRMYPSLQFAQGIPGVTNGKHSGCMDLYFFGRGFTDAVALLAYTPHSEQYLTEDDRSLLSKWFADMAKHMVQNPAISPESKMKNNHGVYYDLTVTSLALLAGDEGSEAILQRISGDRDCWEQGNKNWCLHGRFESQVEAGIFKYELHRADAGHYLWYTLLANSCLATFGARIGNYAGFNGALISAADWALKHALYPQDSHIAGQHIYAVHAYRMLAVRTGYERYEEITCEIQKALSKKPSRKFWENEKIGLDVLQLAIPPLHNRECSAWNKFLKQYADEGLRKKRAPSSKPVSSVIFDTYSGPGLFRTRDRGNPETATDTNPPSQKHVNPSDRVWTCFLMLTLMIILLQLLGASRKVRWKVEHVGKGVLRKVVTGATRYW